MDIFFCDSCSARVTDSHLRRGHGVRSDDVIVCGSCIEQGRGKDLLDQARVQDAEIAAEPALAGAGVLDGVRDRARTIGEDDPPAEPSAPPAEPSAAVEEPPSNETYLAVNRAGQVDAGEVREALPAEPVAPAPAEEHPVTPPPKARRGGTSSLHRRDGSGSNSGTVRPTAVFKAEPLDPVEDDEEPPAGGQDPLRDGRPGEAAEALFTDPEPEDNSGVFDSLLDDPEAEKQASAVSEPAPAESDSEDLFSPVDADEKTTGIESALDDRVPVLSDAPPVAETGPSTEDLVAQLGAEAAVDDQPEPPAAEEPEVAPPAVEDTPGAAKGAELPVDDQDGEDGAPVAAPEPMHVEDVQDGDLPDALDDGAQPEPTESPVAIDPASIPDSGEFKFGDEAAAEFTEFAGEPGSGDVAPGDPGPEDQVVGDEVADDDTIEPEAGTATAPDDTAAEAEEAAVFESTPAEEAEDPDLAVAGVVVASDEELEIEAGEVATMPAKFEVGDDDTKSNPTLEQIDEAAVDLSSRKEVSPDDADDDLQELEPTDAEDDDEEEDARESEFPEVSVDESDSPEGTAIYSEADKEAIRAAVDAADEEEAEQAKPSSESRRRKTSSRGSDDKKPRKSTRKSTRGTGKKQGMPWWFIPGMAAIPIMCLLAWGTVRIIKSWEPTRYQNVSVSGELENRINDTAEQVRMAVRAARAGNPDMGDLEAARDALFECRDFVNDVWQPEMERQDWSPDDMDRWLKKKKFYDLMKDIRTVNDEIAKNSH